MAVPSVARNPSVARTSGAMAKAAAVISTVSTSPTPAVAPPGRCGQNQSGTTAQAAASAIPSSAVLRTSASEA